MKLTRNQEKLTSEYLQKDTIPFKQLSFKQKLTYIWDYYKLYFLFGAIFITLAVVSLPSMIENHKECVQYSVFLNTNIENQESTNLMDNFTEYAGIDMHNKRIILDTSMYIDREVTTAVSMQNSQKLTALFSSKTVDTIVSDEANFKFYAEQGCFYDLKDLLPADICEKYADCFIEATNINTGETHAYGFKLTDNTILNKEAAYNEEITPVFSICVTSSQVDNSIAFLNYLLSNN